MSHAPQGRGHGRARTRVRDLYWEFEVRSTWPWAVAWTGTRCARGDYMGFLKDSRARIFAEAANTAHTRALAAAVVLLDEAIAVGERTLRNEGTASEDPVSVCAEACQLAQVAIRTGAAALSAADAAEASVRAGAANGPAACALFRSRDCIERLSLRISKSIPLVRAQAPRLDEAMAVERKVARARRTAEVKANEDARRRAASLRRKEKRQDLLVESAALEEEQRAIAHAVQAQLVASKLAARRAALNASERIIMSRWPSRCHLVTFEREVAAACEAASDCPICFRTFEEGERIWRLPCAHGGCEECFERILRPELQGRPVTCAPRCPLCRSAVGLRPVLLNGSDGGATAAEISAAEILAGAHTAWTASSSPAPLAPSVCGPSVCGG